MNETVRRPPRLYVEPDLGAGARVPLDAKQAHYLAHVLRLADGDPVLAFNGRDGEWRCRMEASGGRRRGLHAEERTRPQPAAPDLVLLFVPLKQARLDYMIQKAVELGVGRVAPVLSDHGQVRRVNAARLAANAVEAAEQCGILTLPGIAPLRPLAGTLARWPGEEGARQLLFCDEATGDADPLAALAPLQGRPLAVLVGPEGGFSAAERQRLRSAAFVRPLPLGPRILRADTAAVAALTLAQAVLGDWRTAPPERL